MFCPNCRSDKLVTINLKVSATADEPLTFRSCRNCEHKWWKRPDGAETLALTTVLELAKVRRTA